MNAPSRFSALVVEDEPDFRESLSLHVERGGYETRQAGSLEEARQSMASARYDVVLLDLRLPDGDGIELLRDDQIAATSEFIVITGNASVHSAVQALREGALDYLTKPIDLTRLNSILSTVSRTREFKAEVKDLREELRQLGRFGRLVGRSAAMQSVYDLLARVAPTEAGVLLTGESGTGKELAAETIHLRSRRRHGPFLAVNCGAIAKSLFESELFGHEKGSFTGAENRRRGYFEEAHEGTLFLDEVTEMPLEFQAKLLRVLESGAIIRVGAAEVLTMDVRVIAATNRNPEKAVRDGMLREDLFYRLNVFPVRLPPLRERGGDVELLANHFLDVVNMRDGTQKRWEAEALARLREYPWPGNVRELKNSVERAAILADTTIGAQLVLAGARERPTVARESSLQIRIGAPLEEAERQIILATLEQFKGDKRRAADALGIGLKTLYNRLNVYQAASRRADRQRPAS